ncbi:hypothetical protein FRUB_06284 [Fimbriiglobus ruber]|uniref:Mobile element protein n=1 Tax=Fimbriiglobus ruber TaxID=1908690 RepID=A0A225DCI6_9BACT|nr:hypothetical protein FRUB_06284 [Fimbriiglobus ruber]
MMITAPDPSRSPKLPSWHSDRAAIVYVRQSPPQQVADHQESTARQYALAGRAVALGWARDRVTVIDDDLGKSGPSIEGRPGFQRLLAEVARDRIGLIPGLEMSRLARSCKDWHQLLELRARFRVLLADAEGVFDPTEYSDRLLLGLHGMMSEAERHVLKQRMHPGKLNKARRGDLIVAAPLGYLKPPDGSVVLDPDEQARGVVRVIFDQFDRQGTAHAVLRYLNAHEIRLPVRTPSGPDRGHLDWRRPCRETIRQVLRHPMSAGAYRYGHRPTDPRRPVPGRPKSGRGPGLDPEDCLVFLKDRFPAYISWDPYQINLQRLAANRSRSESPGATRTGAALLAGVGGAASGCTSGTGGPVEGRPTCVAPTGPITRGRCASRPRPRKSSGGWPSRCCSRGNRPPWRPACRPRARSRGSASNGPATGSSESSGRNTTRIERPGSTTPVSRRTAWWPGPWNTAGTSCSGRWDGWKTSSTGSAEPSRGYSGTRTGRPSGNWPSGCRRCGTPRPPRPRIGDRSCAGGSPGWYSRWNPGRSGRGADRVGRWCGSGADDPPGGAGIPAPARRAPVACPGGGLARAKPDAGRDRRRAEPVRVPQSQADRDVYRRDGAAVARRTGLTPEDVAGHGRGRGLDRGRVVAARAGASPGGVASHAARVAEEGMVACPPSRRAGRPVGRVGRRHGDEPVARAQGMPAGLGQSGSAGDVARACVTCVMAWRGPVIVTVTMTGPHTTCNLEVRVTGPSRTNSIGFSTWYSGKTRVGPNPGTREPIGP